MRRKLLILTLVVVCLLIATGVICYRATRLSPTVLVLPEGDLVFYANLKPAPFVNVTRLMGAEKWGESDPEYRQLVTETNFHVDKDLDEIAISFHPAKSVILRGRFDQERLRNYLLKPSTATESYAGRTILTIEKEQRTFVCVIDSRTLGVTDDRQLMHTMIDKITGRRPLGPMPPLLRDYYRQVPFGSVAWLIFRGDGSGQSNSGSALDLLLNSTSVVSIRYLGSLRAKAEIITPSEPDAARLMQSVQPALTTFHDASQDSAPMDLVIKHTRVQQNGRRVEFDILVSDDVVKSFARLIR